MFCLGSASRTDPVQISVIIPTLEEAEQIAHEVTVSLAGLDAAIAAAVERWRADRIGIIERNILRLGLHELRTTSTPPAVVISEALRLAHWFAGSKAPPFINGVLHALAHPDPPS